MSFLRKEEVSSPDERMKARTQAEKAMMGENVAMLRSATKSAVELPIANTAERTSLGQFEVASR